MDHVAILRTSNFKKGDNILGDIFAGDAVYFKEAGRPVTAKAYVSKVLQYDSLGKEKSEEIIKTYGKRIAPNLLEEEFFLWAQSQVDKNYCILIFLEDVRRISPFNIDKTGFGSASAWLVVKDIGTVKKLG